MISLLSQPSALRTLTVSPRLREWKHAEVTVSSAPSPEFITAVVDRLIEDADVEATQWPALVEVSDRVFPPDRQRIWDALGDRARTGAFDGEAREAVWGTLRKLIATHRDFSQAEWALPPDQLDRLEVILQLLTPEDVVALHAWVFEDFTPDLGEGKLDQHGEYDHAKYTAALSEQRRTAIEQIEGNAGFDGVRRLMARSVVPQAVGASLAEIDDGRYQGVCVALLESEGAGELDLALGYVSRRFVDGGWPWVAALLEAGTLSPRQEAWILLTTRDYPRSWEVAEERGHSVATEYWRLFAPLGLGPDYSYVDVTARRLIDAARPGVALRLVTLYARNPRAHLRLVSVAADALDELLRLEDRTQHEGLRAYDFQTVFDLLEQHRAVVGIARLARVEWACLPALGFKPRVQTLQEAIAEDPSFFVELVSTIYKGHSEPKRQVSEEQARIATVAYQLLSSWTRIPGTRADDSIDGDVLQAWVRAARSLLN